MSAVEEPLIGQLKAPDRYQFDASLRFIRMGRRDPTCRREPGRLLYARDYSSGASTLELRAVDNVIHVSAWGPGAAEALDKTPALLGFLDGPVSFETHPVLKDLTRRFPGLRLSRQPNPFQGLVQTILQQLVTWIEAASSWRELCELHGRKAPGPHDLLMPPTAPWLRRLNAADFTLCDISERRATALREVARLGDRPLRWLEESPQVFTKKITTLPGVGPWTASHFLAMHWGDPDTLIVGDFGFPHLISWALKKQARSDDEEMAQLLSPFVGQRFRVLRLLMAGDIAAPRFGPKVASSRQARRHGMDSARRTMKRRY